MLYIHRWNLPEALINKLGLVISTIYIGESFVYDARIYEIPEIGDVFVMECDGLGNPKQDYTVDILFKRSRNRGVITVTHEFLKDITREAFVKFINREIAINFKA